MFKLTPTDLQRLKGVDQRLVNVILKAAETADTPFKVLEGLRDAKTQMKYFKAGTSKLDGVKKKSKHQIGKAVDIVPLINGKPEHRSWKPFYPMADNVLKAAKALKVPVTWGGSWKNFPDGPHFELP